MTNSEALTILAMVSGWFAFACACAGWFFCEVRHDRSEPVMTLKLKLATAYREIRHLKRDRDGD